MTQKAWHFTNYNDEPIYFEFHGEICEIKHGESFFVSTYESLDSRDKAQLFLSAKLVINNAQIFKREICNGEN